MSGDIWSKSNRPAITQPTVNEHDYEEHPAFGMVAAFRVSSSPPGSVLFQSDIHHHHSVMLRISRAERKRDLNHDHVMGRRELIEIEMSESQWGAMLSSMNTSGTPCTLRAIENKPVDRLPYQPRLQESMQETHEAAERAFADIREALAEYEAHKTKGTLATLRAAINNATANVDFAGKSLAEHGENVVNNVKADVEAFVATRARQLGIEPGVIASPLELTQGEQPGYMDADYDEIITRDNGDES